jgi:ferritin
MIDSKMEERLNQHLNAELQAEYLYLAMSAYFSANDLMGCAGWMLKQAKEEHGHAMRFFKHLEERNGRVELLAIDAPPKDFSSTLAAFEKALAHERKVTEKIHSLVELAVKLKDHAAFAFLQWFVDEQVEEEATVSALIAQLKRIGESGPALNQFDAHLGKRGEK